MQIMKKLQYLSFLCNGLVKKSKDKMHKKPNLVEVKHLQSLSPFYKQLAVTKLKGGSFIEI